MKSKRSVRFAAQRTHKNVPPHDETLGRHLADSESGSEALTGGASSPSADGSKEDHEMNAHAHPPTPEGDSVERGSADGKTEVRTEKLKGTATARSPSAAQFASSPAAHLFRRPVRP